MKYRVQYTETKPGGTRVRQDTVRQESIADVWTYLAKYAEVTDVTITEFGQSDSPGRVVFPCSPAPQSPTPQQKRPRVTEAISSPKGTIMNDTSIRHADLATLAEALQSQRTRSVDLVTPSKLITVQGGGVLLAGMEPVITDEGVSTVDGIYTPTAIGEEGFSSKLNIPLDYLRRMRAADLDLYDANVNGWLRRDDRKFLLRLLRSDDAEVETAGVLRAFLSDSYKTVDNLDVLLAALAGMRGAGVANPTIQADLTDRRMYVRVVAPEVAAMAPELLKGYRSPFTGKTGEESPIVFAGLVITNSDTGNGAFTITPRIEVEVCTNGMTFAADAERRIHLGAKLNTGVVKASDETMRANLKLVTEMTTDAVRTFLSPDYLSAKVSELETKSGAPVADPVATIATVSKSLGFTKEQAADILGHFITGGQLTAGGVMQAVTSAAQLQTSGDGQWDMEAQALPALELVAALRK